MLEVLKEYNFADSRVETKICIICMTRKQNKNISYSMLFEGSKEILNLQIHIFVAGMGSASR